MKSKQLAVRIDQSMAAALEAIASGKGQNESELIRDILNDFVERNKSSLSCFEMIKSLGILQLKSKQPKDLSSNKKYFEGFGT